MKYRQITFIIFTLLISLRCEKISTPDDEAKAIFGEWEYSHDTGGFSGAGGSNMFKDNNWIEFTEKGVYKIYEGGQKTHINHILLLKQMTMPL